MSVKLSQNLIRPQFTIQFKQWRPSNFGDYIEYEMIVQVLEGTRQTWMISKRYTDFVKLNEILSPYFRIQLNKKSKQTNILPMLPPKISGQTDMELNARQKDLESYMQHTLLLLNGQAQLNEPLIAFLEYLKVAPIQRES